VEESIESLCTSGGGKRTVGIGSLGAAAGAAESEMEGGGAAFCEHSIRSPSPLKVYERRPMMMRRGTSGLLDSACFSMKRRLSAFRTLVVDD
jgi:hypothetical protein